jgi:ABC-type multidrug transport system ATPase subunit/sugar lactone lactonase YvrE
MNRPLWRINQVTVPGNRRPRLDDVSCEIPAGVTAVLGQSGAGKTTLLNLLVDFERPSRGAVARMRTDNASHERRLPVFWSPPGHGLWPHLTVEAHLTSLAIGANSQAECDRLLSVFELESLRRVYPGELSQGERDRLSFCRALASGAEVLVLDEPLVHVQKQQSRKYWAFFQAWRRETNTSVIMATHDPELVLREAEHVICLDDGRIVYAGGVEELYHSPRTEQQALFLGPINFFDGQNHSIWLGDEHQPGDRAVRPERLQIERCADGPCRVIESVFAGPVTQSTLENMPTRLKKTFWHRSPASSLTAGMSVSLKVLLALCLFGIAGCWGSPTDQNSLPVRGEEYWNVPPEGTKIPAPRSILAGPNEEYFVLDNGGRVLVYGPDGKIRRKWWMPEYSVGKPEGLCVMQDGRIAVADTHYHRVVLFDHEGNFLNAFGKLGREPGEFIYPVKVVQDESGDLFVAEYGENDRVQRFHPDGTFVLQFGSFGTEPGQFQRPSGVAMYDGKLYIVDAFNNRIQVFSREGEFLGILADDPQAALYYPYDITVTPQGEFYVVEYGGGRVSKLDRQGKLLGRYGSTGTGAGQFSTPWGLTVDAGGRVLVADTGNRRVVGLRF